MGSLYIGSDTVSCVCSAIKTFEINENLDLKAVAKPLKKYLFSKDKSIEYKTCTALENYYLDVNQLFKHILRANIKDYLSEIRSKDNKKLSAIKRMLKAQYINNKIITRSDLIYKSENTEKLAKLSYLLNMINYNIKDDELKKALTEAINKLNAFIVSTINFTY